MYSFTFIMRDDYCFVEAYGQTVCAQMFYLIIIIMNRGFARDRVCKYRHMRDGIDEPIRMR